MATFKQIPDSVNYYAGDDGNIYSKFKDDFKLLRHNTQTSGKYYYTNIIRYSKRTTYRVHRLVCEAFHGPPPDSKSTCSHLDGNWKNNKPDNLIWETMSENHKRKLDHGTDDRGINNSRSIITLEQLNEIRKLLSEKELTQKQIGAKFGLTRLFITKIKNGYRYKDQGDF